MAVFETLGAIVLLRTISVCQSHPVVRGFPQVAVQGFGNTSRLMQNSLVLALSQDSRLFAMKMLAKR